MLLCYCTHSSIGLERLSSEQQVIGSSPVGCIQFVQFVQECSRGVAQWFRVVVSKAVGQGFDSLLPCVKEFLSNFK